MSDCDHIFGYSRKTVTSKKTGETFDFPWMQFQRLSENQNVGWWLGELFRFCPLCGFKFPEKSENHFAFVFSLPQDEVSKRIRLIQRIVDANHPFEPDGGSA